MTCVKLAHRDEPAQIATHINAVGSKCTDTAKPSVMEQTDGFVFVPLYRAVPPP